jgi:uncharacterized protein YbjT (DUF2867 family)
MTAPQVSMGRTALVAGATGLVGKALVKILLENREYTQVTVLVRRPVTLSDPKLKVKVIDFDELEVEALSFQADDVLCCLGTTIKKAKSKKAFRQVDFEYPLSMAKLANVLTIKSDQMANLDAFEEQA